MEMARSEVLPPLPPYLHEFAPVLQEVPLYETFVVELLQSGDGTALVISTEEMLQHLNDAVEVIFDFQCSVSLTNRRTVGLFTRMTRMSPPPCSRRSIYVSDPFNFIVGPFENFLSVALYSNALF